MVVAHGSCCWPVGSVCVARNINRMSYWKNLTALLLRKDCKEASNTSFSHERTDAGECVS